MRLRREFAYHIFQLWPSRWIAETGPGTFRIAAAPERMQYRDQQPIDRTTMNTWEDQRVVDVIAKTGRKKLVVAAL